MVMTASDIWQALQINKADSWVTQFDPVSSRGSRILETRHTIRQYLEPTGGGGDPWFHKPFQFRDQSLKGVQDHLAQERSALCCLEWVEVQMLGWDTSSMNSVVQGFDFALTVDDIQDIDNPIQDNHPQQQSLTLDELWFARFKRMKKRGVLDPKPDSSDSSNTEHSLGQRQPTGA